MKFSMIFEGVDRATKVMNKIMTAEKKAAASVKASSQAQARSASLATRASEKLAASYSKISSGARSAFNVVVAGAQAAGRAVAALHRQTLKLAAFGFGQIGDGAGKVFRGLALAAGVTTTVIGGSALAAGQLVGTASQFEKFQTILETTEGTSAKAKTAMAWVTDFAVKTPYELDQVMGSFVKLRSYGLDPTNGMLQSLGDTSAAMGKPLEQAVEAMADAVTGENERLKEFGITASKTGNKITYSYTNAAGKMERASVKANDRIGIQTKLMQIFNQKYGGAMEKLSHTWEGMTSNLSDLWMKFQLAIMNAGLFDWMKGKLQLVLDTVNQMQADGTLDKWAKDISTKIIFVLENAWSFAKGVWKMLETLGGYLQTASDYVGGWENLGMVLAGIAFAPALISTAAGLVQIVTGLAALATGGTGIAVLRAVGLSFRLIGGTGMLAVRSVMLVGRAVMMLAGGSVWAAGTALKGIAFALIRLPSVAMAAGRSMLLFSRSLILMTIGAIRALPGVLAGMARSLVLMVASGLRSLPGALMAVTRSLIALSVGAIRTLPATLVGIARSFVLMSAAGLRALPGALMAISRSFVMMAAGGLAALPGLLASAGSAFMALGAAMMATPIGWIVAGIAAVAAGAYLIYQNWDKIGPWLADIWDGVQQKIQDFWNWLSSLDWMELFNFDWSSRDCQEFRVRVCG